MLSSAGRVTTNCWAWTEMTDWTAVLELIYWMAARATTICTGARVTILMSLTPLPIQSPNVPTRVQTQ